MVKISFLLLAMITACGLMACVECAGVEFHVGGSTGWVVPDNNDTQAYNHWAMDNRFHVGDSVYFKYTDDSVLVVDKEAYGKCNTTDPLLEFADGNTTFQFDRYGFFYFISGSPGHCKAGQRLIVRVMVHSSSENMAASPGPGPSQHQPDNGGHAHSPTDSGGRPFNPNNYNSGASMSVSVAVSVVVAASITASSVLFFI